MLDHHNTYIVGTTISIQIFATTNFSELFFLNFCTYIFTFTDKFVKICDTRHFAIGNLNKKYVLTMYIKCWTTHYRNIMGLNCFNVEVIFFLNSSNIKLSTYI